MDYANNQTAWSHLASFQPDCSRVREPLPNPRLSVFDRDLTIDDQAAILGSKPYSESDLSLSQPCICCSVDDRSPAPLLEVEQPDSGSGSIVSLGYRSSASCNATHQVSELLPLEPLNQPDSQLKDVLKHAAILDVEPSLPLNLPLDSTSTICPPPSNPGHSHLLDVDAALPVPLGVKQVTIAVQSKRCTRCWILKKRVYLHLFKLLTDLDKLTSLKCKRETFGTEDLRCLECIRFDVPACICSRDRVTQHRPFEKCTS